MTTKESPTVKEDGLHSSDLPGVLAIPHERAKVQSSGWHDWLLKHTKFRFETATGSFSAFKSAKGKWSAQKRVDGKLRHQYLGESHTLTYETLDETAQILGTPDYWHKHVSNKGRPREADKELKQESHTAYETNLAQEEIAILREEVQRLKHRNIHLENENERLERLGTEHSHATFSALREKHHKALADAAHWREVAESYRKQAEKLRVQTQTEASVDPSVLFNQLRPLLNRLNDRERRAIQHKLEEILE